MLTSAEKLILIVDDQESDVYVLTRSLRRLGVQNPIHRVTDGHEALRYLNGDTPYADRNTHPFPAIVFLDLKLPVVSGFDVLEWIRGVCARFDCQIFIYSQLSNVGDVRRVYAMGANSFLQKPINEIELMNLIYHFPKHWDIQRERAGEEPVGI